jgi:hypothetical protein
MGRLDEARLGYNKALLIKEKTVSKETESYAVTLDNLAQLNQDMGRLDEARLGYEEALLIKEKTVGKETKSYAVTLDNLAVLEVVTDNPHKALKLMQEAANIHTKTMEQVFNFTSEQQKLDYLQQNYFHLEIFLSLVNEYFPNNQEAVLSAYDYVLSRKAIVSETALKQQIKLFSGEYPHLAPLLEQRKEILEQIAFLRFQNPAPELREGHFNLLSELYRQKDQLETQLSQNMDFKLSQDLENANRRAVALALPEGSTLVEFVRFRVFDFKENQYLAPRYLAFILPAGEEDNITMIDLGEAETIDRLIQVFRNNVIGG